MWQLQALTEAGTLVGLEVVTKATLTAVAQAIVVRAVTEYTDVLAASIVSAARVHH